MAYLACQEEGRKLRWQEGGKNQEGRMVHKRKSWPEMCRGWSRRGGAEEAISAGRRV